MQLRILLLGLLLPASASADAAEGALFCRTEPELRSAAALLLQAGRAPEADELRAALRRAGSDLVGVRALYLPHAGPTASEPGPKDRVAAWLKRVKASADAGLVCGGARAEGVTLVLATARGGSLQALDDRSARVTGSLAKGFARPELVTVDGYGELARVAVDPAALERGVPLDPELPRPATIQLVAQGPYGPRPVAQRELPASVDTHEHEAEPEPAPELPGSDPREKLASLRAQRGLPPLRDNQLLTSVAKQHAQKVCAEGRIAHVLEADGDPKTRLRRAGIGARKVGEAIARAGRPEQAFAALLRSPAHLHTLVQRGFTDAGVGVAGDSRAQTCLVVLLAAWPRPIGAAL